MRILVADSSKAQMKIQQMAFMIVALVIFFSLVALFYFSVSFSNLGKTAQSLQEDEARELVRKIGHSSELAFTSSSDCNSCIDFDKALMLKEMASAGIYSEFWNLDYLMIEKVYPKSSEEECTRENYPNCGRITLIQKKSDFGAAAFAPVALARWDDGINRYRYDFGKIYASGGKLNG